MKYIDFDPLENTATVLFTLKELESLSHSNPDFQRILAQAKTDRNKYNEYAKAN